MLTTNKRAVRSPYPTELRGRALAAAAQAMGCRCAIVLHGQVGAEREQAIAAYNAEIFRIAGNYDDSVEEAARLAQMHGCEWVRLES